MTSGDRPHSHDDSGAAFVSAASAVGVATFRSGLRSFLRASEQIARANGLTPQRHLLLLMIKGSPDGSESATISSLVERLELAQSTVTELVQRAEEAGLILRRGSVSDARVACLTVSPEGERRLAAVFRSHDDERRKLMELLTSLAPDEPSHDP